VRVREMLAFSNVDLPWTYPPGLARLAMVRKRCRLHRRRSAGRGAVLKLDDRVDEMNNALLRAQHADQEHASVTPQA